MSSVTLFQGVQGTAVRLAGQAGTKARIDVSQDGSGVFASGANTNTSLDHLFVNFHAIVTDLTIEEAANANAMYAADGRIYMHVPGDKLGSAILSGIAFDMTCGSENPSNDGYVGSTLVDAPSSEDTGVVRMLKWYRRHRISNPNVQSPLKITLPSCELYAYLASFSSRVVDVANSIYSFSLPMYLIPEEADAKP
jgi:hypothetical protein